MADGVTGKSVTFFGKDLTEGVGVGLEVGWLTDASGTTLFLSISGGVGATLSTFPYSYNTIVGEPGITISDFSGSGFSERNPL